MSVSLYYEALRETPLSGREEQACREIVERFSAEYPFGEKYEDFCVYEHIEPGCIFSGATKLPLDDVELAFEVCGYWVECLDEITRLLSDARWLVHLDDQDFYWDEEKGWGPELD